MTLISTPKQTVTLQKFPTLLGLFRRKPYLAWYSSQHEQIPVHMAVKYIISYGNYEDLQLLFSEVGIQKVREMFHTQEKEKGTFRKSTIKFIHLYFEKHA